MYVLGFIIGVVLGVSIALWIIVAGIKKSNDFGDSKASFYDFSNNNLQIMASFDKVNKSAFMDNIHKETFKLK